MPVAALRWGTAGLMIALGTWAWWRQRAVFDDAFISFRYARNLASGLGLTFNPGERVEGYSNLAWVLWTAGGLKLGLDPVTTARVLGVGAYLLTIGWISHAFSADIARDRPARWLGVAWALLLVVPPGLAAMAGSGLETSFAGLLIVAMGLLGLPGTGRPPGPGRRWLASGLAALLCITRPEGPLLVVAFGLAIAIAERGDGRSWRESIFAVARAVALPIAVVALHTGFRLVYFGHLLPNPYFAKGADVGHVDAGWAYCVAFVKSDPVCLVLLGLLAFGLARAPRPRRAVLAYAGLAVLLYTAYVVRVGGDFMQFRFMWQIWPLLVLGGGLGWSALLDRRPRQAIVVLALGLPLLASHVTLERRFHMQSVEDMRSVTATGWQVAPVLGDGLPPDTVISTTMIGVIGYASGLRVVDQWGLTEPYVRAEPAPGRFVRGHLKPAPLDYLKARGVNLYLDHPRICACDRPCPMNRPTVLIRLSDGQCLSTWLLGPTPELVRHLCAHPEHFVTPVPLCSASPGPSRRRAG